MSEWTGSSELDVRLTKAKELIGRGKQRRALDQLWEAERAARGRTDGLQELVALTAAFAPRVELRQQSRLADLLQVLRRDIETASRSPLASPLPRVTGRSTAPKSIGWVLLVLVSIIAGGLVGLIGGWAVGIEVSPPDPNAMIDLGGGPAGGLLGLFLGAVGTPVLMSWRRQRRRLKRHK